MKISPLTFRRFLILLILGLIVLIVPTWAALAQEPSPPDGVEAASRTKAYLPFIGLRSQPPSQGKAPYPPSPVIEGVSWDWGSLSRAAAGSDLFPLTWADDGELYTAWGDGQGFSESGGKQFMGVSRLSGSPENYSGEDLWSGTGKAHGILSIAGKLYLAYTEQDGWLRGKVGYSSDHGRSWTFDSRWTFSEPGGAFASPAFLQFGQDYAGARDNYVYGYSERVRETIQPDVVLFRAPKDRLMERGAYEFFAGLDGSGKPRWTVDVNGMRPVFSDPNGVTWGMEAVYNPVLKRYLLTVRHDDDSSGWGLFDAPEPWGPWTTVAYYDRWLDSTPKIMYSFNQKWMSADGRTMWMAFSGLDDYDSFNLIRGTLELKDPGETAPTPTPEPAPAPNPAPQPATEGCCRVNFQAAGSETPAGFLADTGAVFAARGDGLSYGWNTGNASNARDRDAPNSPDQQSDTLNHMQNGGSYNWEIAVPNGVYSVQITAGDPLYTDSVYQINVEGRLVVDGQPAEGSPWITGAAVVTVSDGRLTVSNGPGAQNNKINYIEISPVGGVGKPYTIYLPLTNRP